MKKSFLALSLTLSLTIATHAAPPLPVTQKPILSIPKAMPGAIWVPVFFGDVGDHETINGHTKLSGLPSLQALILPAGDIEIRIWEGFGEDGFKGYILRRTKGIWSAIELLPAYTKDTPQKRQRVLPTPKSGWASFWSKIEAKGLLTLPDDSTIPDRKIIIDGRSYVVEILNGNQYRTYHYNNPDYQTSPQDRQMVAISKLIHEEFKISMAIFFP